MKKGLSILMTCILLFSFLSVASAEVSILGRWETEIMGRRYLLVFYDNGTLEAFAEAAEGSTEDHRVWSTEPSDRMGYIQQGDHLTVGLPFSLLPEGNTVLAENPLTGVLRLEPAAEASEKPSEEVQEKPVGEASVGEASAKPAEEMPSKLASISFGARAPQSLAVIDITPQFHVTLNADGTGELIQSYFDVTGERVSLTWSWSGSTLTLNGENEIIDPVSFSGGRGIYHFFGEPMAVELPEDAGVFFLQALGYIPEGVLKESQGEMEQPTEADQWPQAPAGDQDIPESPDEEQEIPVNPASDQERPENPAADPADAALPADGAENRPEMPVYDGPWNALYQDFILNECFRQSGQKFYDKDDIAQGPSFCLFDLDQDGTPEMLAGNGTYVHADVSTYLFAVRDDRVSCLGSLGGEINRLETLNDSRYPGLLASDGGMGYYWVYYYTLDSDGNLKWDEVMSIEQQGDYRFTPETDDQAMTDLIMAGMWEYEPGKYSPEREGTNYFIHAYTLDEIRAMGWDAFIAACLPGYAGDGQEAASQAEEMPEEIPNPLIMPSEGEQIDLWRSDGILIQWHVVPGATGYEAEVKCSWLDKQGKGKIRTLYRGNVAAGENEADGIVSKYILLEDLELEGVPRREDLHAWVILTVDR